MRGSLLARAATETLDRLHCGMIFTLMSVAFAGDFTAMVGFSSLEDVPAIEALAEAHGGRTERCFSRARFCVLEFPPGTALPLDGLAGLPGVRYAEADARIVPTGQQGQPADAAGTADCTDMWELEALGAADAWDVVTGSEAPVVAIADAGFLSTHEELLGTISGQYDYGNGDSTAEVEWDVSVPGHGTFIATLIAGVGDNGVGRTGLLPDGQVNLLKIADSYGYLYFSYAASALADIAEGDLGIGAVNYSIASSTYTDSFKDAVDSLADVGIVMVAAAGNCGSANCSDADNDAYPLYPASFSSAHVITVAGSTRDGGYNTYSHYGSSSVDLAAPGVDLCSAGVDSTSDYYTAAGTSYATPLVAAAAALLMEAHPELTTTEVARVLRASVIKHEEWAERVRAGGSLSLSQALDTAVPRLSEPLDVEVDGRPELALTLSDVGAEGEGYLLLGHGEGIVIEDAEDWVITPYSAGDVLELPDAGSVTMTGTGTLLTGALAAHSQQALSLTLAGKVKGAWPVTVRLVVSSAGADYLNAPYDEGSSDETGFLAYGLSATVTAIAEDKETPEDTAAPADTASPAEDTASSEEDTGAPADTAASEEPPEVSGCGCASDSRSRGSWLGGLWVLALVGLRRRSLQ